MFLPEAPINSKIYRLQQLLTAVTLSIWHQRGLLLAPQSLSLTTCEWRASTKNPLLRISKTIAMLNQISTGKVTCRWVPLRYHSLQKDASPPSEWTIPPTSSAGASRATIMSLRWKASIVRIKMDKIRHSMRASYPSAMLERRNTTSL